jgi:hypothetical protein
MHDIERLKLQPRVNTPGVGSGRRIEVFVAR